MAKKTEGVSNAVIIAALLAHGTIKAAACAVGLSERAVSRRMKDKAFVRQYDEAKEDVVRGALCMLNNRLADAVNVVVSIMADEGNNAVVRLQAAQTIINNAGRFADRARRSPGGGGGMLTVAGVMAELRERSEGARESAVV